jgi:hypothetical protein
VAATTAARRWRQMCGDRRDRYACRPAQSVILPGVIWTEDSSLVAGRATSGDHDLAALYQRWTRGDFTPGPGRSLTADGEVRNHQAEETISALEGPAATFGR